MAAKKRRKVSKRAVLKAPSKRRRKASKRGLGGSPADHEAGRRADKKTAMKHLAATKKYAASGKCRDAVEELVDGAYFQGATLAEAMYSRGRAGTAHHSLTSALRVVRAKCDFVPKGKKGRK